MANSLSTRSGLAIAVIGQVVAGALYGQAISIAPTASFGLVSQNTPLAGYAGIGGGLGLAVGISRYFFLSAALDAANVHEGDAITLCIRVGTGCLDRPRSEAFLNTSIVGGFQWPHPMFRPYAEGGVALVHSLAGPNPGERRTLLVPQVEAGVRLQTAIGRWGLGVRWRQLHRWRPGDGGFELALLLGFRTGRVY